jgi:ADP-ribose pyrophosphatase
MQKKTSKTLHKGKVFNLRLDDIILPSGDSATREVIEHPGAVVIVPVLSCGRIIVLEQYRHPLGKKIFELPAGTLEEKDPLQCAKRELIEETGFAAKTWQEMGLLYPTPGICDEIQFLFVAKDLEPSYAKRDEDEIIDIFKLTSQELELKIRDGNFNDAKSISAFYRAKLRGFV